MSALASSAPLPFTFNKKAKTVSIQIPADRDAADFVIEITK